MTKSNQLKAIEESTILGYNKDAVVNIYVANLAKYTEGELVGEWIALPKSEAEIQEGIKEILGNDEEYAIHDYEAPFRVGEYDSITRINEIAETLQNVDEEEDVLREIFGQLGIEEGLEILEDGEYRVYHDCSSMADVVREMEEEGCLEISYIIKDNDLYFDYDQLSHDMDCGGDWSEIAYSDADNILGDHQDHSYFIEDANLIERIEAYQEDESEEDEWNLKSDIADYIMENVQTDEWKRDWMEEIVNCSEGEFLQRYFDYEAFGRDVEIEGNFTYLGKGLYLEITN